MATKKKSVVEKRSAQGPVIMSSLFGRRVPTSPKNDEEYLKLFGDNPWVYSSVWAISNSGANLPMRIFRKVDKKADTNLQQPRGTPEGWEDVTDQSEKYGLVRILQNPNPSQTTYDLLETTLGYLELAGRMYWEVAEMKNGEPGELYPVRPTRMLPVADSEGFGISGYVFKVEGSNDEEKFEAEEIIPFRYFDPLSDWGGQAAVKAATVAIILDQQANELNQAFFANDASPSGVLQVDREISEEEFERLSTQWKIRHKGARKSFKTALLPPGVTWSKTGDSLTEMKFEGLRKMNRQEILTVFGVPPVKVGLLEYAKYSNFNLQEKAFYQDTIRPKMHKIESSLDKFLAPRFAKEGVFRVRFDMSEYLADDFLTRVKANDMLFRIGARNANEIRKELGLGAPYEEGNQYYVTAQVGPAGELTVEQTEKRWLAGNEQLEQIVAEVREQAEANGKSVREIIDEEVPVGDDE